MKTKMNASSWLYFTRSERNGIIFFAFLCLLIFWLPTRFTHWKTPSETDFSTYQQEIADFTAHRHSFSASALMTTDTIDPNSATEEELLAIGLPAKTARTILKYRENGGRFRYKEDLQKIYTIDEALYNTVASRIALPSTPGDRMQRASFVSYTPPAHLAPFDPNTATEKELRRLGIPTRVVKNLINYRAKGGFFNREEDLQRIYGLNEELYETLAPYIRLDANADRRVEVHYAPKETPPVLDINLAPAEEWRRLPGIGPVLSTRIVKFRDKLGGFTSVAQVSETYGLPDSTFQKIEQVLIASPVTPSLKINQISVEELQAHPYLNWRQARAIINYRIQHGTFANLADFARVKGLTEEQRLRLEPYLSFE